MKTTAQLLLLLMGAGIAAAQPLLLSFPHEEAEPGALVTLNLKTEGFEDIVSVQFSVNWEVSVLQYLSHESGDLPLVAVGANDAPQGLLSISWFDVNGTGVSLPDGSNFIRLKFLVVGPPGSSSPIALTDDPLPIQIFQAGPNGNHPMDLLPGDGLVEVVESPPFSVSFFLGHPPCHGGQGGFIQTTLTGDTSSLSFAWTGPDNFQSDQPAIQNLTAGEYTLLIRDEEGAVLFDTTLQLLQPPPLLIDSLELTPASCGAPNGAAAAFVSGGTPPYRFVLEGDTTTGAFQDLPPGSYLLTVLDSQSCRIESAFSIDSLPPPVIDLGADQTRCIGETALLEAGDFVQYQWSNGSTEPEIEVQSGGIYSVTVTDELGCTATDSITLEFVERAEARVARDDHSICPGDSVYLQGSGGPGLTWVDTSGLIFDPLQTEVLVRPTHTTRFLLTAQSACGNDTASVLVRIPPNTVRIMNDTCVVQGARLTLFAEGGHLAPRRCRS